MQEVTFKPKITPTQVTEELTKKITAKLEKKKGTDCASASEKTLPLAEKEGKKTKKASKERKNAGKEAVTFPLAARINPYGFIFLKAKWLAALSWHVEMALKIDKNPDGSVTVRKAS